MAKNDEAANAAEFMFEMLKHQGVACATVKDGHVLMFKRETLEALIERCRASGTDELAVFVKRSDGSFAS